MAPSTYRPVSVKRRLRTDRA